MFKNTSEGSMKEEAIWNKQEYWECKCTEHAIGDRLCILNGYHLPSVLRYAHFGTTCGRRIP